MKPATGGRRGLSVNSSRDLDTHLSQLAPDINNIDMGTCTKIWDVRYIDAARGYSPGR